MLSQIHLKILGKLTAHFGAGPALIWDPNEEGPQVGCAYFSAEETGRPWGTLATFGMSLQPMVLDDRVEDTDTKRAEIIAYVNEDEKELDDLANVMRWTGAFPFLQEPPTFLGWGHTIHMHDVFPGSALTTILTLTSIVIADQGTIFQVNDDDVAFLWLTFLTDGEYKFKKERGVNEVLDLFGEHRHPVTLDRARKSYV